MAEWKKVIVSGSSAVLSGLTIPEQAASSGTEVLMIDTSGAVSSVAQSTITGVDTTYTGSGAIALDSNNTFSFDGSQLTDMTQGWTNGSDEFVVLDSGVSKRKLSSEIFGSNAFNSTTIGTTTNNLTFDDTTVQLNTGTVFNGSAALTVSAKTAAVTNGGGALATGDQIFDHVQTITTQSVSGLTGNTGTVTTSGTVNANEFARFSSGTNLTALTYAETKTALSLENVENTALSTWAGSGNITSVGALDSGGSITSGFGSINVGSSNITSTGIISGSTMQTGDLTVSGSAQMVGNLIFNGVTFSETAIMSHTGSHVWGSGDDTNTHEFTGSVYVKNDVHITDDLFVTDDATISGDITGSGNLKLTGKVQSGTWEATDVGVAHGGTGASNASGARTNLGLVIGTNVQAYDAGLADIAGLAVTDGNIIVGNGSNFVAESGATARTSLGLAIGTNVQAYDAGLTDIAGLAVTDGNFIVGNGSNFVAESGATARTSLGVDAAGTDNSTPVTLANVTGNYLTITGQAITAGTVPVSLGGTGNTSMADKSVIISQDSSTDTLSAVSMASNGQILIGGTSGPTVASITPNNGITIAEGDGSVGIAVNTTLSHVTSIKNNSLIIGRSSGDDHIDFDAGSIKTLTNNVARLTVTDATTTVSNNLAVTGNLTVSGTTTTVNTETILLADNFITLNSDIANTDAMVDSGITINGGSSANQSLYYDATKARWATFAGATNGADAPGITALEYMVTAVKMTADPVANATAPNYGNDADSKKGQMGVWGSEIYIYV